MVTIAIKGKLEFKAYRDQQSRRWIAVCEPLKLTLEGKTYKELTEAIAETLQVMFVDLLRARALESFLEEHGWEQVDETPAESSSRIRFDIPFAMKPQQRTYDPEAAFC